MRRLPACGIPVLFLAFLVSPTAASADPINLTSSNLVDSTTQVPSLNFLRSTLPFSSKYRDGEEGRLSSVAGGQQSLDQADRDDFPLGVGAFQGLGYNKLWLDSEFSISSLPFTPFAGAITGHQDASQPERGQLAFSHSVQGGGTAAVASTQSGGQPIPSASASAAVDAPADFAGSSSVVTPEPATLILLGSGVLLTGLRARRKRA